MSVTVNQHAITRKGMCNYAMKLVTVSDSIKKGIQILRGINDEGKAIADRLHQIPVEYNGKIVRRCNLN